MKDIKFEGRSWGPQNVASQSLADFIADPAHAIPGKSEKDNKAILTEVHKQCTAAVAPPAEPAKGKKAE